MRTVRVLLVEDDPVYQYLVKRAFKSRQGKFRWDLNVVGDGEEAIGHLFVERRKDFPDLILLDWNLPKVHGNEVLRRLKEDQRLRRIPILIFSSSEADKDIYAAYDNHANGYIVKPDGGLLELAVEAIETFWVALAKLPRLDAVPRSSDQGSAAEI